MKKSLGAILGALVFVTMLSSCFVSTSAAGGAILGSTESESTRKKASESFVKKYGDHPTVLVYGLIKYRATLDFLTFMQLDSRLPPSVLKNFTSITKGYAYYGEALCGASYKLYSGQFSERFFNTITHYIHGGTLNAHTYFDFNAPKTTGIYYLGMKDRDGNILLDDEDELRMKVSALRELVKEYQKTDWAVLLNEELEKAQSQLNAQKAK